MARIRSRAPFLFLGLGLVALGIAGPVRSVDAGRSTTEPFSLKLLENYLGRREASGRPIRSIPELLSSLKAGELTELDPMDQRSFFLAWTAVHHSQSRQYASPENPRILMRSSTGKFIMAFTGEPGSDSENLEVIELNPLTKKWEFAEVRFDRSRPEIERKGAGAEAKDCVGCHQGRPNWHSYRIWPGVFKSNDDVTYRNTREYADRKAFIQKIRDGRDPKYAMLDLRYFEMDEPPHTNTNFSVWLGRANFERIARILSESPRFRSYQYALLAAVTGCSEIESFIPASVRAQRHPKSLRSLGDETRRAHEEYYRERLEALGDNRKQDGEIPDIEKNHGARIAAIRYVVQGMGLDRPGERIEDWSMSPGSGKTFAFQSGFFSINRLDIPLAREMLDRGGLTDTKFEREVRSIADGSMSAFGGYSGGTSGDYSDSGEGCRVLRGKSLQAFR
jgi:hypothetical protein